MSDITREEAIKILKDTLYDERTPNNYIQAVRMGREALENQKTGHWIRITNGAIREKYTCSECGRQIEDCGIENLLPIKYPYCHCGAKMEGE